MAATLVARACAFIIDPQHDLGEHQRVQEILTALAEIDHAYEVDLETVRTSDAPVTIKQRVLDTLRQRHQEHRAPYVQALAMLPSISRTQRGIPSTKMSLVRG